VRAAVHSAAAAVSLPGSRRCRHPLSTTFCDSGCTIHFIASRPFTGLFGARVPLRKQCSLDLPDCCKRQRRGVGACITDSPGPDQLNRFHERAASIACRQTARLPPISYPAYGTTPCLRPFVPQYEVSSASEILVNVSRCATSHSRLRCRACAREQRGQLACAAAALPWPSSC
jgi:hypothetical protein